MDILIEHLVSKYKKSNPIWNRFFSNKDIKALIECAILSTQGEPNRIKLLKDYVEGLALVLIKSTETENPQNQTCSELMMPVINLVLNQVKSDSYRLSAIDEVVTGDEVLEIDGVKIPITNKELFLYIRKTNTLVFTRNDIPPVIKGWKKEKKELFSDDEVDEVCSKYKYDPETMARVYNYCNNKNFECSYAEFLKIIESADFSKLKPLSGSKSKIPRLINLLFKLGRLSEEWYTASVLSLGRNKSDCTGKYISPEWVEGVEAAILNKQKK